MIALVLLVLCLPAFASAQTVTASPSGNTILVSVSNGPGNATDWVALVPAGLPDNAHINWVYLNGSRTPPASGVSGATIQFPAPTSGTFDVRLFANNRLPSIARSAAFTIGQNQTPAAGRIVFNGDSNSSNYYVSGAQNWTAIVAALLGFQSTNLALEGKYASRVLQEVPQMLSQGASMCVVMIGTNDMAHAVEVGTRALTALHSYLTTMRSIITGLTAGCRVVILSPPFVMNAREAARYDAWVDGLQELCAELDATFVNVYGHMKALSNSMTIQFESYYRTPGVDAYHLSAAGHAVIADFVTRSVRVP